MAESAAIINGELWARRLALFCLACIALVGLFDFFFFFLEWFPSEIIARSFDISRESSLGTWVSTSLALITGFVAAAIFASAYRHDTLLRAGGWAIVALFFLYVSFDDAAKFHERVGTAFEVKYEKITDQVLVDWFPSWGWQLFVAPFFVAMGLYLCWFFYLVLPVRLKIWMFVGLLLFGTAVAADFIEGTLIDVDYTTLHLMRLAEETLEMVGTTAFLYTFLSVLNDKIEVQISRRSKP